MGDIIDFPTRKVIKSDPPHWTQGLTHSQPNADGTAYEEDSGLEPEYGEARMRETVRQEIMRRANLMEENALWAEAVNARNTKVRYGRASFFVLGIAFGFLHWWWAMAIAAIMMFSVNRLTKKV